MSKRIVSSINVYDENAYEPSEHPSGARTMVRVMARSADGRVIVRPSLLKDALTYRRERPAGFDEVVYVVRGTMSCVPEEGADPIECGAGDLVYLPSAALLSWEGSADLLCVILLWSGDDPLENLSAAQGEAPAGEVVSVFDVHDEGSYERHVHPGGTRMFVKTFARSRDNRVIVRSSFLQDELTYRREQPAAHDEVFYIVRGQMTCVAESGDHYQWGPGDLVFMPAEDLLRWEGSDDLLCVLFTWSDEASLTDLAKPEEDCARRT